ncbi:MAG: hypothetical protein HY901_03150 [Deltaproteobacteria bacterium]|nr:hypothetical protein [Deltaproteobacteria bacterium]
MDENGKPSAAQLEGQRGARRSLVGQDPGALRALRGAMKDAALQGKTVEEAAQAAIDVLYEECQDTIALGRLFVSRRLDQLPDENQRFVQELARSKGLRGLVSSTPVLSLLGTRGEQPGWNDRRRSQGHVGIPLLSDLVRELPMITDLLKALGIVLDKGDSRLVIGSPTGAIFSGMFHVPDARAATDEAGRKVIPAQDFVEHHGIRTVFGVGGLYLSVDSMLAMLVFCREGVEEGVVRQLVPFASSFAAMTSAMIVKGDVFRR